MKYTNAQLNDMYLKADELAQMINALDRCGHFEEAEKLQGKLAQLDSAIENSYNGIVSEVA